MARQINYLSIAKRIHAFHGPMGTFCNQRLFGGKKLPYDDKVFKQMLETKELMYCFKCVKKV